MDNYSFDQSETDTVIFSIYAVLRKSGYSGPVVIDAADTDRSSFYFAAAARNSMYQEEAGNSLMA